MSTDVSQNQNAVAPAAPGAAQRLIWLCADDYGISPGVNKAIRDLIVRGRLNATSVMVAAPSFNRSEAAALNLLNADARRVAIGLHVTLTRPFQPLSERFRTTRKGTFPSLAGMFVRGTLRLLGRKRVAAEIAAQMKTFVALFGRPPDFVDGHQHVHLFPQVRDALLDVVKEIAPRSWVRQCSRAPAARGRSDFKGTVLDTLSRTFRSRVAAQGIKTNAAFAGTYNFKSDADFARLFPEFLAGLPAQGLIMCHPGFVDAELQRLDPLTTLREREYAYFSSDAFPEVLRARGVTLAPTES